MTTARTRRPGREARNASGLGQKPGRYLGREPHAVLGLVEGEPLRRHAVSVDRENDWLSVSGADLQSRVGCGGQVHVMTGHTTQSISHDRGHRGPGRSVEERRRRDDRSEKQVDLNAVTLVRSQLGPRVVEAEPAFVVAVDDLVQLGSRHREVAPVARVEKIGH